MVKESTGNRDDVVDPTHSSPHANSTAVVSDDDEQLSGDLSWHRTCTSLPSTCRSERGHIPLTSGHYYPVIMCCATWLHLLFLCWQPNVTRKQFYLMNGHEGLGGGASDSCLTSELYATKCSRCPNQLSVMPASANILQAYMFNRLGNCCRCCADLLACHNMHEDYSLPLYLLVLLNQTGHQSLHYQCTMKNCWLIFKQA